MNQDEALDILKNAILLERRGKAFYAKVAEQAESQAVRDFFGLMADEEDKHVAVLSQQFASYQKQGRFAASAATEEGISEGFSSPVLSDRVKREVSAASFEAAAIAASLSMERNATRFYGERANAAEDPEEKALYAWLAQWEQGHLEFLARLERELTEAVWNENHFWPY